MDVLVDTLKQAQQAVLHAQHDLITIRQQQRDDSVFASSLDCKDLLSLQLRSQSKQEDAIQYLEDGVKLLCHLVKDFSLQHNVGESSYANPEEEQTAMCAVKKAMRRYVEGQRNLQVEWEEKLREQISASNAFIISLRNSMVSFAQQAFMRRQKARVLQCWRLKAFRMRSLRERSSITRGLGKMRTIVAKSYASVKERSDLRVRCFYRWRVRYIYAMNARSEAEKVELKTELRRLEMEAEKHVKLVDELNCGKEEAERRLRCGQQEQKKELTRLKAVMNETVLEFSKRSDTYVQQQEEMTRHYEERGKLLAKQVVKAETESKKFKEGARLSAQCEDHMRMLMDITCTDVSEFSLLKAEAIQNEVLSVGLESVGRCCELQAQLREQEKQLKLLTTMEGHVASLEASSAEMKRQLDEQSKKIVELNLSLQRADERGLLRQCWSTWRKGISNRYREEALRTREVMFEQLVENEMISRRFLVQQQATSRETIIAQHEANAAEIVSEMRYIELVKVRNHCKQLQGENALERQSFERCREAYDTLMRELFDAQADSLNAKEQTMRTALRYDEQRVRQMLWARFTEDCTTMLTNCELNERRREKMLMQSALVATQFRLREVGGLVVEYCAREAFTCWLLYTERRKHCREKECMERRNSCNVAMAASALLWFDGSAEFILDTQQRKLKLVEAVMTHSALSHANGVLVRQQQLFEADVEVRLGQISSLWVAFATNAGCWCAAQEGLLVEAFCSGCSDTRTGAMGGIIAPLAERTKGFLSAEATILSDHVSGLMDAVQCVAVTALEEQRKRHEESTKEMLEYQSFLEQRITAAGMLGAVTTEFAQDTVVRVHIQRGALEKSELAFRELQSRVDRLQLECDLRERDWREREASLCEALERSKAACGDAQDRLAQVQLEFDLRERDWRERERSMRTALLKQRDCESKLSELESCCEEHVQCTQSVEGEASVANGEQQREVGMLQAENQQLKPCLDRPLVENSMNDAMRDLLSQYKRVLVAMETDVLSRRGEFASYAEALTDVEAFSKVLLLRYEEDLNQLMAEKRRVQLKGQEVDEVMALQEKLAESRERIGLQQVTLNEIKAGHEIQLSLLEQRVSEEEKRREAAERAAASLRSNYEREMSSLRIEGKRLEVQLDELQAVVDSAEEQRELLVLEAEKKENEMRRKVWRLETDLQTNALRHAVECDSLRGAVLEQRQLRDAAVKMACSLACFPEEITEGIWELVKTKCTLFFSHHSANVCNQRHTEDEENHPYSTIGLRGCVESILGVLERTNVQYENDRKCQEIQLATLQQIIEKQKGEAGDRSTAEGDSVVLLAGVSEGGQDAQSSINAGSWSAEDMVGSIVRYSDLLREQHTKNCARLKQLDALVEQLDGLMECSHSIPLAK